MPNESLHAGPHHERLDADAVCEQCGTVNPEETLICKTCGNNLRDQRMRRIAAGGDVQAAAPKVLRWSWLASALTVLGLILLVWAAMNAEEIMQAVFTGDESGATAQSFWNGPQSGTYESLRAELVANPVSDAEAQNARTAAADITDFTGRYVIVHETAGGARTLGSGIARHEDATLFFVALLDGGGGEIRGEAQLVGESTPAARDTAAILVDGEYHLASGVALKREENLGGYLCHAQTMTSNPISVVIYKVD